VLDGSLARAAVESELVQRGVAAYEALDFQDAVNALEEALDESLTREERIVTFRTLGFAYAALGRNDDARTAFVRLLRVDAAAELDRSVAPKVRALFEEARAQLATGRAEEGVSGVPLPKLTPSLQPTHPEEGHPLTVTVAHPGGVAQSVCLFHRVRGQLRYSEVQSAPKGDHFELVVPGADVRAPGVELYLTALDDAGATVAAAGTLGRPIIVEVTAARRPAHKRGWVWGVVGGVLVAGGIVAAVLATTLRAPDPHAAADVTLIAPR
jgi:hypothetical protein